MRTFAMLMLLALFAQPVTCAKLSFDLASAKKRPVTMVITLLNDMKTQLEKEAEEDEDIYDQLACWCATNDKEKTKAIKDAEAHIADLTSTIDQLTARTARFNSEIKDLSQELAKNQEALDEAIALRQKQLAEFNGEEKDMLEAISALKSAIVVLSKHHTTAMLQSEAMVFHNIATTVEHQMSIHESLFKGVFTHKQRKIIDAFMQSPADTYEPQSGQIFGILDQMKETFESNLAVSQKEEARNQQGFEDLKTAKEEEIEAGQAQLDNKAEAEASAIEKLAEAKEDIEDSRSSLEADNEFLMTLKEKCSVTDTDWEERQKTRQAEITAVAKALAVLSSDEAHDTFTKTFNPALLQREIDTHSERRARASRILTAAASRFHSPRLGTLATRAKLDGFAKVKKAINDLVAELLKEKADEIKHKDFCVSEFTANERQTEKKEREKADLTAHIDDLQMTIQTFKEAIEGLNAEMSEMKVQLKLAGEDREKANRDFQMTVADQRETQKLLRQALAVLQGFYKSKAFASVIQTAVKQPAGFDSYKKNAASSSVLGLLQQIISDAKTMEADAIRAEEDSQKAYEDFVKDTNSAIEKKGKDLVAKTENKAKAEGDLVDAKGDFDSNELSLEHLDNSKGDLHKSCDFLLKNFEIRQSAREEEVEALKQANGFLSGALFDAFLQQP